MRKILNRQISFFSGEEFNVEPEVGLAEFCDFMISLLLEQLFIEAPAVVIVEAKKENFKGGLGQCIAEMIAAQRFNAKNGKPTTVVLLVATCGHSLSVNDNLKVTKLG